MKRYMILLTAWLLCCAVQLLMRAGPLIVINSLVILKQFLNKWATMMQ